MVVGIVEVVVEAYIFVFIGMEGFVLVDGGFVIFVVVGIMAGL